MLEDSIIQPNHNHFSSLVLLVKKKDETWHFCMDCRELNSLTAKAKYPIPINDDYWMSYAGLLSSLRLILKLNITK